MDVEMHFIGSTIGWKAVIPANLYSMLSREGEGKAVVNRFNLPQGVCKLPSLVKIIGLIRVEFEWHSLTATP